MNQSEFLAITCNLFEAREKSRVPGGIGLGFVSHWWKNWREIANSHLKTILTRRVHESNLNFIGAKWKASAPITAPIMLSSSLHV